MKSRPTPYAIIKSPGGQDDDQCVDKFALVLPTTCRPLNTLGQAEQVVHVRLNDGMATWMGAHGIERSIGSPDEPIEGSLEQAMRSVQGLLVLYVDEFTATPSDSSIFLA